VYSRGTIATLRALGGVVIEKKEPLSTDEWEVQLGQDIKKMRKMRGRSQKEIAEATSLSLTTVKKIEAGRGSSLSTLILIARALDRKDWLSSFVLPEPTISPWEIYKQQSQRLLQQQENSQEQLPLGSVAGRKFVT
jgi:transcriptional regulator with XRE-family HTH domain